MGTTVTEAMTLRDVFAAHALGGIIAAHNGDMTPIPTEQKAAKWAYEYADAMLAERGEGDDDDAVPLVPATEAIPADRLHRAVPVACWAD